MNNSRQTVEGFNVIFIHSSLDDAGLTPHQFRVLAHLTRRAGNGAAWSANETMAKVCRMDVKTITSCLADLERLRIISRKMRPGKTTIWTINPPSFWSLTPPVSPLDPSDTPPVSPLDYPTRFTPTTPPVSPPGKVIPLKEIPFKEGDADRASLPGQNGERQPERHVPKGGGEIHPTRRFSDAWCAAFQQKFGEKYRYQSKDGVQAARLLKDVTPEEAIETAKKAWNQTDEKKFWNCIHMSRDVAQFASRYVKIRLELKSAQNHSGAKIRY